MRELRLRSVRVRQPGGGAILAGGGLSTRRDSPRLAASYPLAPPTGAGKEQGWAQVHFG